MQMLQLQTTIDIERMIILAALVVTTIVAAATKELRRSKRTRKPVPVSEQNVQGDLAAPERRQSKRTRKDQGNPAAEDAKVAQQLAKCGRWKELKDKYRRPKTKLLGCGIGNNPNSQTIGYYDQWKRETFGNSFICFMSILLCIHYTGYYPDDFPLDCEIWWTVENDVWTIYIENLPSLVRYMKIKAYGTNSAEYIWMLYNQKYGMIHPKESPAYDCRSDLATKAALKDPTSVIVVQFIDILPSITRKQIDERRIRDSDNNYRRQQQIVYDNKYKTQYYVSAATDSIGDPSHLVTYSGNKVSKYCNGGRQHTLERRLADLKQEYVNDRSKPTRVLKWPTSDDPQYSIICKSRNHVVRGFNEAVRDEEEDRPDVGVQADEVNGEEEEEPRRSRSGRLTRRCSRYASY